MKCLCAFYMVITLIIQTPQYSIQECTNYYIILVKEQGFPTLEPADMKTISWDYPWNATEEYKIIQSNKDCVLELTCGGIDTECIRPVKAINQSRDEFITSLPTFNAREPATREKTATAVATKGIYTDIEPIYTTESFNVSTSTDKSTLVTNTFSKEDNTTYITENNTIITIKPTLSVNSVKDTKDIDIIDTSITTTEMSVSFTNSTDFATTSIISTTKKSTSLIPVVAVDSTSITTDVSSTVKSLLTEVDSSINPLNPPDTEVDLTTETLFSKTESSQVDTTTQINNSSGTDLLQKQEEDKNSRVRIAAVIIGGLAATSMMILLIRKILEKMQSATYRFPDPPEADTRV